MGILPSSVLLLLVLALCTIQTNQRPLQNADTKYTPPSRQALDFMKRYGYIASIGVGNSEALYTERGLENVIREVQRFGGIKQSGKLDNATIKLMQSRRCGNPDVIRANAATRPRRYVLSQTSWKKRRISYFVGNWPPNIGRKAIAEQIHSALSAWGRYGRLIFYETFDTSADIVVAFVSGQHGDSFPFDGKGNTLAHAFFPSVSQGLGGDVHFDADENWTVDERTLSDEDTVNFFDVAVHELGHSLGLSHSPEVDSVMFPYYKSREPGKSFDLGYDDILGMYELYIKTNLDEAQDSDNDRVYYGTTSTTTTEHYEYDEEDNNGFDTTTISSTFPATTSTTTESVEVTTNGIETTSLLVTTNSHTISYEGDYESVETHLNHNNLPTAPSLPDICQAHFDAVTTIRDEIYIFKDRYVWRLSRPHHIVPGYPVPIKQIYPTLPEQIKKVDAVYERPNRDVIFFSGKYYWIFDGTFFSKPHSLTELGLPDDLSNIDAAVIWSRNHKTYFFNEGQFWRYNESTKIMDEGYPKLIKYWWNDVPTHLDAATTYRGFTYFFKGNNFYKFDNDWIRVSDLYPLPVAQVWLACPKEIDNNDVY